MAHLVWDWNGTLLDDLTLVVAATNVSLAAVDGPPITADDHRRDFRRPVADYYGHVLGRSVTQEEFVQLDRVYHDFYRDGLLDCALAADAEAAMRAWPGTQSLLSMWFHEELVPEVTRRGLHAVFERIDGLRPGVLAGGHKAEHLAAHLDALGVAGADAVLIGDSVDDAHAAASAGAACILYGGGFTHPERLLAAGVPVASTLLEAVALAREAVGAEAPDQGCAQAPR
ncbi:HAD family hydrolase [Planosporangium thailandense]|uniref:HAD family hydrolase n=1 Tax=Planosporangium thailandense TaxID=765197 RepID=UPI0030B861A9